jgi:hypothetical protein
MIVIRALFVTAATLLLAALACWHAALLYWRGQNPDAVPALFARDPDLPRRSG